MPFSQSSDLPHSSNADTGIPILLKIKINRIASPYEGVVYEKKIFVGKVWAAGSGKFDKFIDGIKLNPGNYHLEIESLNNMPELSDTEVDFAIGYPRGK